MSIMTVGRGEVMGQKNRMSVKLKKFFMLLLIGTVLIYGLWQMPFVQKIFYPYPYRTQIEKYAAKYGVDPLLVVSVMREESKFIPKSESHKGARGLMQLMPNTAQWIAQMIGDKNYKEEDLVIPEKNIQYGTWYLASLEKQFYGNTTLALAAYNGGRGHVQEWIKTEQIDPQHLNENDIPFLETREYVKRVLQSYQKYVELYRT